MSTQLTINTSLVYCRAVAPGTFSLTGDWARDDDSKQYRYYNSTQFISPITRCFQPNYTKPDLPGPTGKLFGFTQEVQRRMVLVVIFFLEFFKLLFFALLLINVT